MTEEEIVERIRKELYNQIRGVANESVKIVPASFTEKGIYTIVGQILSIEGLAIIDNEAELPKLKELTGDASITEKSAYLLGASDMREEVKSAGWRKVIK